MKLIKNFILMLMCAIVVSASVVPCYASDEGYVADSGSSGLTEIGTKVVGTAETGEKLLVSICLALFPISLLVLIILMLVTHNDKKFTGYLWFAGAICLCTLGVLLVENGTALKVLQNVANAFKL